MAPTRTGSVRKRGAGWQARYQRPEGTTTSKTFSTERQAERWIKDQIAAGATKAATVDNGQAKAPNETLTLATWATTWQAEALSHLRPSTRARDASALRSRIIPALGDIALEDISTSDVRRFMNSLTDAGLAPATVTRTLRVLSGCLLCAAQDGLIAVSPAAGIRPPQVRLAERPHFSAEQANALADTIDSRYRALVLVGAYCGLRIGELTGLRVRRVNPLHRTITVASQIVEVGGRLVEGEPKSRAGHRVVPVPRSVMDALDPHLEGRGPEELVFTAPEGGPIRRTLWAKRFWHPALKAAGLNATGVHTLRHTAVSLWLEAGASPLEVTRRAGHSSSAVILDVYGHLSREGEDRLTDRLDEMARRAAGAS